MLLTLFICVYCYRLPQYSFLYSKLLLSLFVTSNEATFYIAAMHYGKWVKLMSSFYSLLVLTFITTYFVIFIDTLVLIFHWTLSFFFSIICIEITFEINWELWSICDKLREFDTIWQNKNFRNSFKNEHAQNEVSRLQFCVRRFILFLFNFDY